MNKYLGRASLFYINFIHLQIPKTEIIQSISSYYLEEFIQLYILRCPGCLALGLGFFPVSADFLKKIVL